MICTPPINPSAYIFTAFGDLTILADVALLNSNQLAGYHSIVWNASDNPSGVYIVRMTANNFIHTKKLMLVK